MINNAVDAKASALLDDSIEEFEEMKKIAEDEVNLDDEVRIPTVPPPTLDLERVANLRQQYIDRFFVKNPALAVFNITQQSKSTVRNMCVDARIISHPLYRPTLPDHFIMRDCITPILLARSMCESLCLEKSRAVLDLTRPGSLAVSCMALDSHNALLACGNERGVFSVYDVDEAHFAIQLQRKILVPTIVIDTKRSISQVVWNPQSGHEDEVLVAFHFSCDLWLYNLSLMPSDLGFLRTLSPKLQRTGGSQCALFWDASPTTVVEVVKQFVIVGGTNGYVRCWRLKQQHTSTPEPLWNMRMSASSISETPVIFLYRIPKTGHLVAINALGLVMCWDLDRVEAVAFSSSGNEPALVYSFDFYPQLVPYLVTQSVHDHNGYIKRVLPVENESGGQLFTVLFESGLICTIDIEHRKVTDILPRYQQSSQCIQANVLGGRTNEAMTLHADALSSQPASSSNSNSNNISINSRSNQRSGITDIVAMTSFPGKTLYCMLQPDLHQNQMKLRYMHYQHHRAHVMRRFQFRPPCYQHTGLIRPHANLMANIESALVKTADFSYTLPGRIVRAVPGEREILVSHDLQHYLGNAVTCHSSLSRSPDIRFEWLVSSIPARQLTTATSESNSNITSSNYVDNDDDSQSAYRAEEEEQKQEVATDKDENRESSSDELHISTYNLLEEKNQKCEINDPSENHEKDDAVQSLSQQFSSHCHVSAYGSQDTTIQSVRTCAITLNEMYLGPAVTDGQPRVQLRTKLQAQQYPSHLITNNSNHSMNKLPAHVSSYPHEEDVATYLTIHETDVPNYNNNRNSTNHDGSNYNSTCGTVTSVLAHPSLPLLFLGQDDGRILLFTARRDDQYIATQHEGAIAAQTTITTTAAAVTNAAATTGGGGGTDNNVYDAMLRSAAATATGQQNNTNANVEALLRTLAPLPTTLYDIPDTSTNVATTTTSNYSNMWRATDVSLNASYSRTQTRILEARPTTVNTHHTTHNPMATINVNTNHQNEAIDQELLAMQTIFQRNTSRNNSNSNCDDDIPAKNVTKSAAIVGHTNNTSSSSSSTASASTKSLSRMLSLPKKPQQEEWCLLGQKRKADTAFAVATSTTNQANSKGSIDRSTTSIVNNSSSSSRKNYTSHNSSNTITQPPPVPRLQQQQQAGSSKFGVTNNNSTKFGIFAATNINKTSSSSSFSKSATLFTSKENKRPFSSGSTSSISKPAPAAAATAATALGYGAPAAVRPSMLIATNTQQSKQSFSFLTKKKI